MVGGPSLYFEPCRAKHIFTADLESDMALAVVTARRQPRRHRSGYELLRLELLTNGRGDKVAELPRTEEGIAMASFHRAALRRERAG